MSERIVYYKEVFINKDEEHAYWRVKYNDDKVIGIDIIEYISEGREWTSLDMDEFKQYRIYEILTGIKNIEDGIYEYAKFYEVSEKEVFYEFL